MRRREVIAGAASALFAPRGAFGQAGAKRRIAYLSSHLADDPLNVMRFDDTIYRMLGRELVGLTSEREMILDPASYGRRSVDSMRLPGALIADFRLTL